MINNKGKEAKNPGYHHLSSLATVSVKNINVLTEFDAGLIKSFIDGWRRNAEHASNESNRHNVRLERFVQDKYGTDSKYGSKIFNSFLSLMSDELRRIDPYGLSLR